MLSWALEVLQYDEEYISQSDVIRLAWTCRFTHELN